MTTEQAELGLRRSALMVATMASFLTPFLASAVNVALPAIGRDLHMDPVALSWVTSAFLLSSAVCLVPCGRIADMVGRKKVFVAGMFLFTVTSLACALARSGAVLIGLRALQGLGGAMIFGTGLAILTSVYPKGERGRVIGLNASAVYIGLSAGPFAGGVLTQHGGWASVFLSAVPLGGATLLVAWRGLRGEWLGGGAGAFDVLGTAIYAAALVALMLGLTSLPGMGGALLAAGGAVVFWLFTIWERRVANPVLDVKLLAGNPVFAWSNVAALINYSASYAATFMVSLYLQYIRGLDPARAGLILLTPFLLMAVMSPLAGWLSDRWEPRVVASAGMALTVVGLAWFCLVEADTSLLVILAALVVFGLGFGLFSSPNTNAVMGAVEQHSYGVASATLGTMRLLGQMVSMGVAAAVISFFVGRAPITPALHPQFLSALHTAFLIFALLCTAGIFASLARGNVRPASRAR
jgi:EmrB/QacA subfamily drug resistance transporter